MDLLQIENRVFAYVNNHSGHQAGRRVEVVKAGEYNQLTHQGKGSMAQHLRYLRMGLSPQQNQNPDSPSPKLRQN